MITELTMHKSVVGCIVFAFSGSCARFGGVPGTRSVLSTAAAGSTGEVAPPILKSGISNPSDCHSLNNLCNAKLAKCNMGTSLSSLSFSGSAMSTSSVRNGSSVDSGTVFSLSWISWVSQISNRKVTSPKLTLLGTCLSWISTWFQLLRLWRLQHSSNDDVT